VAVKLHFFNGGVREEIAGKQSSEWHWGCWKWMAADSAEM